VGILGMFGELEVVGSAGATDVATRVKDVIFFVTKGVTGSSISAVVGGSSVWSMFSKISGRYRLSAFKSDPDFWSAIFRDFLESDLIRKGSTASKNLSSVNPRPCKEPFCSAPTIWFSTSFPKKMASSMSSLCSSSNAALLLFVEKSMLFELVVLGIKEWLEPAIFALVVPLIEIILLVVDT